LPSVWLNFHIYAIKPRPIGRCSEEWNVSRSGGPSLRVSVAGLGCRRFSRLGLGPESKAEVIPQALDLDVHLIDIAAAYGTEQVFGGAFRAAPRDSVVFATKAWFLRLLVIRPKAGEIGMSDAEKLECRNSPRETQ